MGPLRSEVLRLAGAVAALAGVTAVRFLLEVTNPTVAALGYLLVVLITATRASLRVAVVTSVLADLCLNYFFMPPFGTLTIADPHNWVALGVFLVVSVVASNLSTTARDRAREAVARRDELARLFDLSRDVLLTTESAEAIERLAGFIARRFDLDYVAVCLPRGGAWDVHAAGTAPVALPEDVLSRAFTEAERGLEFDAHTRTYSGHQTMVLGAAVIRIVPLRFGTRPVGLLVAGGRPVEAGTLDALAGVVAISVERAQFLEERKAAAVARQSEALKSALLASLAHDLKTPLTAIRVAASNLQAEWLQNADRREQSDLILAEVARLDRLFQNILEMARIEAGRITADVRWVHPAEIVEAAREQVGPMLRAHPLAIEARGNRLVRLDPRLTASALAQVIENAAKYTAEETSIEVDVTVDDERFVATVRDHGPGIAAADLPHVFDRFYRGSQARRRLSGTGMGLAIARGLLAAEQGRIWVENHQDGGALFTIAVPAESKVGEGEAVP